MSRQGIFSRTQHSLLVKMLCVFAVFLMMWLSVEPAVAALQEEEIPYNLEERLEQIQHEVDWEFRTQAGGTSEGLLKQILQRNRKNNPLSGRFSSTRSGFPFSNQQSSSPAIQATLPGRSSTTTVSNLLSSFQNSTLNPDPLAQLPSYARENLSDEILSPPRTKQVKLLAQADTAIVSDTVPASTQTIDFAQSADVEEIPDKTVSSLAEQDSDSVVDSGYMLLAQSYCYDHAVVGGAHHGRASSSTHLTGKAARQSWGTP